MGEMTTVLLGSNTGGVGSATLEMLIGLGVGSTIGLSEGIPGRGMSPETVEMLAG